MTSTARLLTVSAIALCAAGATAAPALAQDAEPHAIEEVIVTAQRRGENLQDVPATVTAITGEALSRSAVQNTSDLTKAVPGLTMVRSTVGSQPTLRGIGTRSVSTGNESNVALYVDGVYQAQPFANFFELNDIERIEVLKGPQGTLYGRNATGGAISIVTKRPSFTPTGSFSASYGTDNFRKGSIYLSGPILGDTLAGSLSVIGLKQDGYIRNVFLGGKLGERYTTSIRAKLLWKISDDFEIGVNAFNLNQADNANPGWHALNGNTVARTLPNPNNLPIDIRVPQGDYETSSFFKPFLKLRAKQYDVNTRASLGWADFNGVVAYKENYANASYDSGGTVRPVTHIQSLRPFSRGYWAEGVLTSTGDGALSWLLGANYFRDLSEARPSLVANALSYYGIRSKAASVFAEASYKITDELSVTGGLRYNYDKKDAFFTPVSPAGVSTSGSKSFDSVTPRLVVKYQPDPDLNFYASYSEGFKSGGFAADSAAGATVARAVEPETVKAYEVGVKSDLIRNLRLNLATFLYNYNDLQVLAVITTPTSSVSLLSNAAKARIYGAEASVDWALTDALTLRGGLSLLHTEFTRFPAATVIEQRPLVNGLGVGNVTVNGVNLKGRELMRAPDHTFNVSLEHRADLLDGELTSTVSFFRSARYWADVNNRVAQPAYNILDATVAWRAPNNITLSVSGKNLTNAKYSTQIFINANGDQVTYDRPRQIIVGVAYDF